MKPIFMSVAETREIHYWFCGVERHRHQFERTANACIAKRQSQEERASKPLPTAAVRTLNGNRWTREALIELVKAHANGERQADIARRLDLSRERIRQLLGQARRMKLDADEGDELSLLSPRARNLLLSERLTSLNAVLQALRVDRYALKKIPNCGKVTEHEIMKWLSEAACS